MTRSSKRTSDGWSPGNAIRIKIRSIVNFVTFKNFYVSDDATFVTEGVLATKTVEPDEIMLIVSGPHYLQAYTDDVYSVLVSGTLCLVDRTWLLCETTRQA